ncbi:5'-nucleotidase [Philodulcilactobacillus myokoensis]|uniref:5'-nucleotidase n=1 Tax=Philodulcilactobacillus myokoensis TaxID=2929573 RepID=A0A9W6B1W9_9LACO|nr:bifunctional UDP-sugar hydrolase/5'-nucleotidase [Philodulcilactobacillus myokoensis]GLB47352.1 5'-nucleotidase [Philodulcilactobacillus myokoensis]
MKLTILATSDTHGYVSPTNYVNSNANMPFGLERAASCIKEQQGKHPNNITIDNGDFLEGSPMTYYMAKIKHQKSAKQLCDAFNLIHYNYGIVGNHEFNYGLNYLKNTIRDSKRQFLCANVIDQDGHHPLGKPYDIKNINGVKVGILGVTTQGATKWESPSNIAGLKFISVVKCAKKYIPILRKQADVVIVAYHGGFERDMNGKPTEVIRNENESENESYSLLKNVKGIDALVSGHQHRILHDHLFGVPFIQAGHRGAYVGRITLDLKKQGQHWQVIDSQPDLIKTDTYEPDQSIVKEIHPLKNQVEAWLNKPLAKINGSLEFNDAFKARTHETNYIEFIQKVQMETMGADISATALFNNEAHGFENPITMRNIITNYIFPNKLALVKITGKDLKAAIEKSAQYFDVRNGKITISKDYLYPKPRHYNYDMYEGIDYVINASKPLNHRVVKLTYHGKPVSDDQELKIVLNQYRAAGGGDFTMFSNQKVIKRNSVTMSHTIADYLVKHPVINATNNHNFKVIK